MHCCQELHYKLQYLSDKADCHTDSWNTGLHAQYNDTAV